MSSEWTPTLHLDYLLNEELTFIELYYMLFLQSAFDMHFSPEVPTRTL